MRRRGRLRSSLSSLPIQNSPAATRTFSVRSSPLTTLGASRRPSMSMATLSRWLAATWISRSQGLWPGLTARTTVGFRPHPLLDPDAELLQRQPLLGPEGITGQPLQEHLGEDAVPVTLLGLVVLAASGEDLDGGFLEHLVEQVVADRSVVDGIARVARVDDEQDLAGGQPVPRS